MDCRADCHLDRVGWGEAVESRLKECMERSRVLWAGILSLPPLGMGMGHGARARVRVAGCVSIRAYKLALVA